MAEDFNIGGESTDASFSGAPSGTADIPAVGGDPVDNSIDSEIEGLGNEPTTSIDEEIDAAFAEPITDIDTELQPAEDGKPRVQAKPADKTAQEDGQPKPEDGKPAEELAADPNAPKDGALPEGVKLRKMDGKSVWAVDPEVGKQTFERAQIVSKAEEIFGEPVTEGALQYRHDQARVVETIKSDLISGTPEEQGNFVVGIENIIRGAAARGECSPEALPSLLRTTVDAALGEDSDNADMLIGHLLGNKRMVSAFGNYAAEKALAMTEETKPHKDLSLADNQKAMWMVGQWIDALAGNPVRGEDQLAWLLKEGAVKLPSFERKPMAAAKAAPAASNGQPANGQSTSTPQAEAFSRWQFESGKEVRAQAIDALVKKEVDGFIPEAVAKKYPENVKHVTDQLTSKLRSAMNGDKVLQEGIKAIERRARVAVDPEIKKEFAKQLVQLHVSAGNRLMRTVKGPIFSENALLAQAKSDQNRARAASSLQTGRQSAPSGGPSTARQNRPAPKTGFAKPGEIEAEVDALFQ